VVNDPTVLPANLPRPVDDGAARHLLGVGMPDLALPSTGGDPVNLARLTRPAVVYAYPYTGRPGQPLLVPDWDLIPGARGCTPESCGFRDHHADLDSLGVDVYGLSTQDTAYQGEAAARLRLPFPLLSDANLRLTEALRLPTFDAARQRLLKRLTLLVERGAIAQVWYPVFPPDTHAGEVLDWLRAR
jgi:peroxiredoxin